MSLVIVAQRVLTRGTSTLPCQRERGAFGVFGWDSDLGELIEKAIGPQQGGVDGNARGGFAFFRVGYGKAADRQRFNKYAILYLNSI